ncbi:MAG: hypothetical protein FWE50_04075 [Alphaproteobacteria bacterium]|nr:hypothetical protein [Alphaproteobacteria bacterium]
MKMKFAICFSLVAMFASIARASDSGADFMIYDGISLDRESLVMVEDLLSAPKFDAVFYDDFPMELCPFHTKWECSIWFRKPHIKESISLPSRSIGIKNENALRAAINRGDTINMDAEYAKPLINRYRTLQKVGRICCTEGMINRLQRAGATPGLIYKFLVDDANFYRFSDRCLMTTDEELSSRYPRTATANAVSDARDTCLCQRREFFDALLAPFDKFSDADFVYTFEDGLKREHTVSITDDVQTVKAFLSLCP